MGYNREQRPDAALDVLSAGTAQAREDQRDSTTTGSTRHADRSISLGMSASRSAPLTTRHVATRTLRGQLREERVLITLEKALAGSRPGGQCGNTTIQSKRVNDRGMPSPKRGAERSFRTDLRGLSSDVQKWTTRGTAEPRTMPTVRWPTELWDHFSTHSAWRERSLSQSGSGVSQTTRGT